jgi:FAD:protein FMN transferase
MHAVTPNSRTSRVAIHPAKSYASFMKNSLGFVSFLSVILFSSVLVCASTATAADPSSPAEKTEAMELFCSEQAEMGTPFKICVYAPLSEKMTVGFDLQKAFRKLKSMNDWMSEWQPGTQLSQVNASAGVKPVKVGQELFEMLEATLKVSEKTEGAFDPTFNAFWGLYNFKPGQEREPTDTEIKERLPLVNYKDVVLDRANSTVFLKRVGMKLGLGGNGQGYGVDHIVGDLKKHYSAGYADGSGDTYFWGKKPDGSLWTTAVRDPRDKSKNVLRIYGTDFSVTTSGDDEKFFIKNGRRIHHILDPKTGRSATGLRQATVISRNAFDADSVDTACVVLGPEKAKTLIEGEGFRGVFITEKGVTMTKGLKKQQTPWGEVYAIEGELK